MTKQTPYNWLPDFVYGGIDGAITTFAVVAGVTGAHLDPKIALILGFANLFGDGFSMATGKYLSDKSELDRIDELKKVEEKSIIEKPEEETEEVRQIIKDHGFEGEDLEKAVKIITSNPKVWVHIMMRHELDTIEEEYRSPIQGATTTFISFLFIGSIPLIFYVLQILLPILSNYLFIGSSILTLSALFSVGVIKSRLIEKSWLISGLETMLFGGIAASIAYIIGHLLRNFGS